MSRSRATPWRYDPGSYTVTDEDDRFIVCVAPNISPIPPDLAERLHARGRLLAAAPDLLAALDFVNEWSIDSRDDDFPYPEVEAALKKARGR